MIILLMVVIFLIIDFVLLFGWISIDLMCHCMTPLSMDFVQGSFGLSACIGFVVGSVIAITS